MLPGITGCGSGSTVITDSEEYKLVPLTCTRYLTVIFDDPLLVKVPVLQFVPVEPALDQLFPLSVLFCHWRDVIYDEPV